jgi:hypothetical protein
MAGNVFEQRILSLNSFNHSPTYFRAGTQQIATQIHHQQQSAPVGSHIDECPPVLGHDPQILLIALRRIAESDCEDKAARFRAEAFSFGSLSVCPDFPQIFPNFPLRGYVPFVSWI